ncbi:MAG: hypothetical protein AB1571_02505 [Nanoarchaeota archaeon]
MIKNKLMIYFVFLFFLIFNVNAIGISPSRIIINFEPNLEETIPFTVYNNAEFNVNIKIYVKGELNSSVTINQNSLVIPAKGTNTFTATIRLPSRLDKPGIYDTRIGVVESTGGEQGAGTFVGAITGVESQLFVQVPYPGKYASLDLEIPDVVLNQPINFKAIIQNLGEDDINTAYVGIDIFDPNNNKVTIVQTDRVGIKTKESATLYAYWIPTNINIGTYKAIATLHYDGLTTNIEKQFKIGDLTLKLINFDATYITENKIIKFDVGLQSLWNEKIDNIFGKITIKKDSNVIGNINTETISIDPWAGKTITTYYPIGNYADGIYNAEIEIKYVNKTIEGSTTFEIINKGNQTYIIYGVIGGLVILIIFLLILYIIALKKKNEN